MVAQYFQRNFLLICLVLILRSSLKANGLEIPQNMKNQARKIHNHCVKKASVDEARIQLVTSGDVPDDQNFKCYLHCIFDTIGVIDSENAMHFELLTEVLPADFHSVIKNLANQCNAQTGADGCDVAHKTLQCFLATDKSLVLSTLAFMFD